MKSAILLKKGSGWRFVLWNLGRDEIKIPINKYAGVMYVLFYEVGSNYRDLYS